MPREKRSTQEEKYTTVKVFNTVFAERLSELIKTRKNEISTEQLAKDLGVSKRVIELWASKQSRPDIERLTLISNYFGVTIDYLVGRSDTRAPSLEEAAICEYTGLSLEVIEVLKSLNKWNRGTWYMDTLNDFIASSDFRDFISLLTGYITESNKEDIPLPEPGFIFAKKTVKMSDVELFALNEKIKKISESLRLKMQKSFVGGKFDDRLLYEFLFRYKNGGKISEVEHNNGIAAFASKNYLYFKDKSNFKDEKIADIFAVLIEEISEKQKEAQDNDE